MKVPENLEAARAVKLQKARRADLWDRALSPFGLTVAIVLGTLGMRAYYGRFVPLGKADLGAGDARQATLLPWSNAASVFRERLSDGTMVEARVTVTGALMPEGAEFRIGGRSAGLVFGESDGIRRTKVIVRGPKALTIILNPGLTPARASGSAGSRTFRFENRRSSRLIGEWERRKRPPALRSRTGPSENSEEENIMVGFSDALAQDGEGRWYRIASRVSRPYPGSLEGYNGAMFVFLPPEASHTIVGEVRTHAAFESKLLGNRRDILVWLPPDYAAEPKRRYPVLYLNDGQNVFDAATSFAGEWRADEAATALIGARRMRPIIMVAVPNMGAARADEYLASRDRNMGGKGDLYGRFLVEELKPFVDRTYRTEKGPKATGLLGSSLGALITLHLGLTRPDVFGLLGVVSPSVWWKGREILGEIQRTPARIWLDIGTEESPEAERDARDLRDALVLKGWREGRDLAFYVDPGAKHNEKAWAGRIDSILTFLFPPR